MRMHPKIRNVALVGALAAVAASAWAANDHYQSVLVPAYSAPVEAPPPAAAPAPQPVAVDQSLAPGESIVPAEEVNARPIEATAPQPRIMVEKPRLTQDERIQAQVMDKLAANSHLSGKIGVVSQDSVVTLSGWTRTAGQAWHAERDARSIVGVKYVQNQIRPRIGGSV